MEFSGYSCFIFQLGIICAIILSADGYVYEARRQRRNVASSTATPVSSNMSVASLMASAQSVPCQAFSWYDGNAHSLTQPGELTGGSGGSQTTPLYLPGRVPTPAPSVRRVALNNSQMHDMFEHKGGTYLQDYMAATQQEAEKNFPNLLTMTAPQKVAGTNTTLTASDNFFAMQTIVDDLKKLHSYISSTQSPLSARKPQTLVQTKPSVTVTTDVKAVTPRNSKTSISDVKYVTGSITKNLDEWEFTTKTTGLDKFLTTVQAASQSSASKAIVTETEKPIQQTLKYDTPFWKTATPIAQPEILTTTMDPEVSKSLSALDRYINGGYSGSNESGSLDFDTIWRGANTTIHPAALFKLKRSSRRRKRQTDGSVSMEQYCQLKGSKTDDGFLHLCSTCAVITQLPDAYFPRYINEAICKTGDTHCFVVNGKAHGQCRQRTITLNIMRKRTNKCLLMNHHGEHILVDDWELYPKTIRVSCECLLDKRSAFARFVTG